MVDEKKLYLMIGLARYKERNKDRSLRISSYYRTDYTGLALMKNFILTTIAYILLVGVIAASRLDTLVSSLGQVTLRPLIAGVIIGYLVMLGLYSAIEYTRARLRYARMEESIRQYAKQLEKLNDIYKKEEMTPDEIWKNLGRDNKKR